MRETVLYYNPGNTPKAALMKSVLVRMGIRIRNVSAEQAGETVGSLLGLETEAAGEDQTETEVMDEQMLVMYRFTDRRLDEFLLNLRRAGVPKIELKAVVTEQNSRWTFYQLYKELKREREAMAESK